ncbi:MAG: flotillin family protein [Acidimicrobiales bacterium]
MRHTQGIPLKVTAVAVFKVGDDNASIANATRRFLAEQNRMEELCGRIFAGHLRSIIGSLTVEEIIRERDKVAQEVKDGSHPEMEKLGIVVDVLQIQEIEDPTGYIANLAAPHAAAVASVARIAAAERDQEAPEKEQHERSSTPRPTPSGYPPKPARMPSRPEPRATPSPSVPPPRPMPSTLGPQPYPARIRLSSPPTSSSTCCPRWWRRRLGASPAPT